MGRLPNRITSVVSHRRVAVVLALLAGVVVFVIAEDVFPYHTSNHDEAVYLQQAAMLLEGQLTLQPPVPESFRPWFFVTDGETLYPKYSPVPAAIFAVGGLLGEYRIALGLVAAGVVALTYGVVSEVFDRATGLVAAVAVFGSPLFLVDAAIFLPYVPTLCLNLLFAWAYLRADRTGDWRVGALAGGAIGLAFFARPYTSVLFATPFVCHALWTLRDFQRPVVRRQGATAVLGLVGVFATLGYNALMTGDPLLFPYEAFAPRDGLGFGRREILGYERTYDISLALEANARVLWSYLTTWSVAPPLGSLLAGGGLLAVLSRLRNSPDPRKLVLAGLFLSVPLGNVYFWGNLNVLGVLSDPTDGLISYFGPYYHVDLLVPTAAFAAVAVVGLSRRALTVAETVETPRRVAVLTVLVVCAVAVSGVAVGGATEQLSENYRVTQQYEQAYEPFEDRTFENALVFLPTPYGDWLGHPFQALRNDPGYDGKAVYALQHRQFEVADAFPNRTLYRYSYHGEWSPDSREAITPTLQRIDVASGDSVTLSLSVGLPRYTEAVEVRTATASGGDSASASLPPDGLDMTVTVENGTVRTSSAAFRENISVEFSEDDDVRTVVFVDYGSLGSFEYVATLPVDRQDGQYRALSPRLEVCRSPRLCGGEAAYVPGTHRDGIWMNTTLQP